MKTLLRDAHAGLLRALRTALTQGELARGLPMLTIESVSTRAWASATFTGQTHAIEFNLRSAVVEPLLDRLQGLDPAIPGHVLIDLAVAEIARTGDGARVVVEALTLED